MAAKAETGLQEASKAVPERGSEVAETDLAAMKFPKPVAVMERAEFLVTAVWLLFHLILILIQSIF